MEVDAKVVPTTSAEQFGYDRPQAVAEITTETNTETPKAAQTAQDIINDTIKTLDMDEKGKIIYPDDIDPMLKAAIGATKSFRDTQSSFTKGQQDLKGAQAEAEALREQIASTESPLNGLSPEEQTQLAELKYTNPDEWYKRLQHLEAQKAGRVEEKFKEVREQATNKTAQEQRIDALKSFNETTTGDKLTQVMLESEVPPRWIKEVGEGKLDFNEFLLRSQQLIFGNKVVVDQDKVDNPTNLNQAAGGTKDPLKPDGVNYADVTF